MSDVTIETQDPDRQPETTLGRLAALDPRDENYIVQPRAITGEGAEAKNRGWRYWWQDGWWGDQWYTPQCVAYAWTHWLEDGPTTHVPRKPVRTSAHGQGMAVVNPGNLYREAQLIDEWAGTDYDGTSVRAGAKVLRDLGLISRFEWATTIDQVVDTVLLRGPMVVGTTWTSDMSEPDERHRIAPTGTYQGGHAYVINGVSLDDELFRVKNSWGRGNYGRRGNAYIAISDFETLLDDWGEACIATEREVAA